MRKDTKRIMQLILAQVLTLSGSVLFGMVVEDFKILEAITIILVVSGGFVYGRYFSSF